MNKRGQGIQFNWIFVLVAGAIFFLFLVGFGLRYVDLSQDQNAAKIEMALDSTIESTKSLNQYRPFTPGTEFYLRYDCGVEGSSKLSVNNVEGVPIQDLIFVNDGNYKDMILWSEDFKQPYRVATLVYLIDKSKKYYINPEYADIDIPSIITTVEDPNDADVRVQQLYGDVWFFDNKVYYSATEFYDISDFGDSEALKVGAIFSSPEVFECNLGRLRVKREIIDQVYADKANSLNGCNYGILDFDDRENLEDRNEALANQECEVVF